MAFVSQSPKRIELVVSSGALNLGPGSYNSQTSIGIKKNQPSLKPAPAFGFGEDRKLNTSK